MSKMATDCPFYFPTAAVLVIEDQDGAGSLTNSVTTSPERDAEGKIAYCSTLEEAIAVLGSQPVHIIVVGPAQTDALLMVERLRRRTHLPIIVISLSHNQAHRVLSLKLGADDYMEIPFEPGMLEARMEAVLRRSARLPPPPSPAMAVSAWGRLKVQPGMAAAFLDNAPLALTKTEFLLLTVLVNSQGEMVSSQDVCAFIWPGVPFDSYVGHNVDVHVGRLRGKLAVVANDPKYQPIHRLRGHGFVLEQN